MFQIIKNSKKKDLHPLVWFFLPIFILLIFLFVKQINNSFFVNFFLGESGIIENGTFIILLFAIITSISLIKKIRKKFKKKNLLLFIIFITLGLIYFAGEEINWGQHWFYWEANKFFETYNDQYIRDTSETNFHNISSWFDQKPKILLTILILFGGIFCPFYFSVNKNIYSFKYLIIPNIYCFPTAFIFLFFYLLDNSYKFLCYGNPGIDISCKYIPLLLYFRTSEIIELYIAIFFLIYILSIKSRLKKI